MRVKDINPLDHRKPEHDIDPLFPSRWSPRTFSGEEISGEELARLFEAARWAPSAFNEQPWRFFYARRRGELWPIFFEWMVAANQGWAKDAGALILIASSKTFARNGKPNGTHAFDTGAAWQNLALQGERLGLVVHAMAGFDHDAARRDLKLPGTWAVEAMVAVGWPGEIDDDSVETPNGRKRVSEIAVEGTFEDLAG